MTQSQGNRPPSLNGSLFVDSSTNRIDYSGTASITRENLVALCDYLFSDRAESDEYGLKLYISGWKKTSQRTGKTYIRLQIEPPKAAYDGQAPAPRPAAPPQQQAPAGAPPQPVWDAATGTWLMPAPVAPPAPAPAPVPQAPPQPVWNPHTQAWDLPPAPGAGGAPGQPYRAPMPPAQAGAVWHSGGHTPSPVADDDIPF